MDTNIISVAVRMLLHHLTLGVLVILVGTTIWRLGWFCNIPAVYRCLYQPKPLKDSRQGKSECLIEKGDTKC